MGETAGALLSVGGEGAASFPDVLGRCVPGMLLVGELEGLSCGLRSLEGTEGGRSLLSGEGLLNVFRTGDGDRIPLLCRATFTLSCEELRGSGGFMAVLVPFLGGSSGGSSSVSRLFSEADLTVTMLEDDVRESLLEATLCLEGDPGEVLAWLRSSLEAEDLVLFVGDLWMVLEPD